MNYFFLKNIKRRLRFGCVHTHNLCLIVKNDFFFLGGGGWGGYILYTGFTVQYL